jgi:hypothetical protein
MTFVLRGSGRLLGLLLLRLWDGSLLREEMLLRKERSSQNGKD